MQYGGAPLDMVFNGIINQKAFDEIRPSLAGKQSYQDNGGSCCGANFWGKQQDHITVNGKTVDFNQIRGILSRNRALKHVGQNPKTPIWTELELTRIEYQHALKMYRQSH